MTNFTVEPWSSCPAPFRAACDSLEDDADGHIGQEGDEWPTDEDLATLSKFSNKISWAAYIVTFGRHCLAWLMPLKAYTT
jgi:hypothetical protein